MIDGGERVESQVVSGWWKDTGQLADMLEANRLVLEELETSIEGDVSEDSRVEGRVVVEEGAEISGSMVRGPAVIGGRRGSTTPIIGPYTSIGDAVEVRRSEIEHSILLAGAEVERPRDADGGEPPRPQREPDAQRRACRRRCG